MTQEPLLLTLCEQLYLLLLTLVLHHVLTLMPKKYPICKVKMLQISQWFYLGVLNNVLLFA